MASDNGAMNASSTDGKTRLNQEFAKNDYYVLSADFQGTTRLNLQQYIWREALGFNIHPSIELGPKPTVADVACGTSLWLTEVGRQLGSGSDLHGFDINLKQAPPQQWLPQNMTLHTWNVFDDVPEEFVSKFDLVHVRLVTVVVKNNDPVKIMQNLYKLLKPGGYLQWDEVDVFGNFVVKAYPELDVPALDALCAWVNMPKSEYVAVPEDVWIYKAGELLQANGYGTAKRYDMKDQFLNRMDLMRYNNDQLLMVYEQYARGVFAAGHEQGAKVLKMVQEAARDVERGAAMIMSPLIWIAKKNVDT